MRRGCTLLCTVWRAMDGSRREGWDPADDWLSRKDLATTRRGLVSNRIFRGTGTEGDHEDLLVRPGPLMGVNPCRHPGIVGEHASVDQRICGAAVMRVHMQRREVRGARSRPIRGERDKLGGRWPRPVLAQPKQPRRA